MRSWGTRWKVIRGRRNGCRLVLLACALVICPLIACSTAQAIVGGSATTIENAPWQAEVEVSGVGEGGTEVERCGAIIRAEGEVLTAAHCLIDWFTEKEVKASQIKVIAGTSDYKSPTQESAVSGFLLHPYFSYAGELPWQDDVAVLTLEAPLTFGTDAKAIGLVPSGSELGESAAATLTGFGAEQFGVAATGELHSIGMTLRYARECASGLKGAANALYLCATAPSGTPCFDDIGSGLTSPGSPDELVGVLSDIYGPCEAGTLSAYGNVGAPEIRDFIEAPNVAPPHAPRGGGAIIRAFPRVGYTMTCEPGSWENSPTFTYTFADSSSGAILQRGTSSTYYLLPTDVGRSVLCEVHATNAGGTGVGRTPGLGPIAAAVVTGPPAGGGSVVPPAVTTPVLAAEVSKLSLAGRTISVTRTGLASVKLKCLGKASCRGKLTLMVKRAVKVHGVSRQHAVTIGTATFTIPGAKITTVRIKLAASGRADLVASHGHVSASLQIRGLQAIPSKPETLPVELVRQK